MSTRDSNDPSEPERGEAPSRDAITPRGGFMARPGLKSPPRHAVIVRLGDAPGSDDIPRARASDAPPAPSSDPGKPPSGEKVTAREIPSLKPSRTESEGLGSAGECALVAEGQPRQLESVPPPSDAPLIASVPPPSHVPIVSSPSRAPKATVRARRQAGWTILVAAAIGLLLGTVSVTSRSGAPQAASRAPSSPPLAPDSSLAPSPAVPLVELAATPPEPPATTAAVPAPSASQLLTPRPRRQPPTSAARPASALPKHSIF